MGNGYSGLLFLILPLILLYMVFVRSRRQQQVFAKVQAGIRPGLRVMTTSGLHATVVSMQDDGTVVLEIAPGVHVRWARAAIGEVTEPSSIDTDLTDKALTADLTDTELSQRDDRPLS